MSGSIRDLLGALEEREVARAVGIPHDEGRLSFRLDRNTVGTYREFEAIIGEFYNHQFTRCVSRGGRLPDYEARGRAKEIIEQEGRRRNGDIVTAYNDAHDGTNGGLRVVLDTISEGLKSEAVHRYVSSVFDRHVAPNAWDEKVALIRAFIEHCGLDLATSIRADQPERYAQSYRDLITAYVAGLRQTSAVFRRL